MPSAQVDRLIKSEEDILSRLTGPADNEQDAARAIESISLRIVRQFQERVECKILDDLSPITAEIHDLNRDYASKVRIHAFANTALKRKASSICVQAQLTIA